MNQLYLNLPTIYFKVVFSLFAVWSNVPKMIKNTIMSHTVIPMTCSFIMINIDTVFYLCHVVLLSQILPSAPEYE